MCSDFEVNLACTRDIIFVTALSAAITVTACIAVATVLCARWRL